MPKNLKRYYGRGDLHFITFSCYRRMALLGTARARNVFLRALGEIRTRYQFALVGYVIMPEHVHLLISEPKMGDPSAAIHGLKLRVSKRMRRRQRTSVGQQSFVFRSENVARFWQPRFYDFNVWSAKKRKEKLEYMHRNPVTRKLVEDPKDWVWSSYASYAARNPTFQTPKRGAPKIPTLHLCHPPLSNRSYPPKRFMKRKRPCRWPVSL